jgi:hypothetical protein
MQSVSPMFVPVIVAIRDPAAPSQLSSESVNWAAPQVPSAAAVLPSGLGLGWTLGGWTLGGWTLGGWMLGGSPLGG